MSDTPQGAGWWKASDAKWYPPETHPQFAPVGVQTQYPSGVAPPTTNGLAVASLVLSIVWISGLGSLLAIIFGFVARSNIKRSAGRQKGAGLALAGIIVGFVGILGGVLLFVGLVIVGNKIVEAFSTKTVSLGTTVNGSVFDPGISSVAVTSIRYRVDAGGRADGHAGMEFVAVRVTECAASGNSQPVGTYSAAFSLLFADGTQVTPSSVTTLQPDLTAALPIGPGRCVRGWITYETATGERPTDVLYSPLYFYRSYEWRLSSS